MPEAEKVFSIPQLTERVLRLETDVSDIKTQHPAQEGQIETLALEMQSLHVKIDALDSKFTNKFDGLETRVTRIEQTMVTKFELQQLRNWMEDQFTEMNKQFADMKVLITQR